MYLQIQSVWKSRLYER